MQAVFKQFALLRPLRLLFAAIFAMIGFSFLSSQAAHAQSIELTSQETMWIDANQCSVQGPRAAWLSYVVTNNTGTNLTGVTVTFAGFTGANASYFVVPSDLIRTVGSLAVGEKVAVYYYVDYSEVCNHPQGGGSSFSGYTANYSITVASNERPSSVRNGTVTTDQLITANAAGTVTTNILGPGVYVGQVLEQAVTYSFGNNSDLFFQPASEAAFKDECLRLIDSKITAVSTGVSGVAIGDNNRLHFPAASVGGGGGTITVTYYWEVLCTNTEQTVTPWAAAKSGNKYKYTSVGGTITIPTASQGLSISKSVNPTAVIDNTLGPVTYRVTVTNSSTVEIILRSITDQLPACMTVANPTAPGSNINNGNSSSIPSVGAAGTLQWIGKSLGNSPNTTYRVPALGRVTLIYTANINNCPDGFHTNSATGTVGTMTIGPATATLIIGIRPALAITKEASVDGTNWVDSLTVQSGANVHFRILVQNTGNVNLTNLTVDDGMAGCTLSGPTESTTTNGILDQLETWTYTCTVSNVTTGFTNTATADSDQTAPQTDSATVQVANLTIAKTPDNQVVQSGNTATFQIEVRNTGEVALTGVTMSDAQCTTLTPAVDNTAPSLPVGESDFWTCTVANVTTGFTNTATADSDQTTPQSDTATVQVANLVIAKTPDSQVVQSGAGVTFTIRIENTGEVPLTNVVVSDANAPACDRTFATVAVGEAQQYTCTLANVTASFINTAIVESDQTDPRSDTASVQLANLTISKSATPTSLPEPGGEVTFAVDIINSSTATLTLTTLNDQPFGDITQVAGAITATDCATPQQLAPAGNQQGFRYTCTFTVLLSGEPGDYIDTVTATLNDRHGNQIQIVDDATVTIVDQLPTLAFSKSVNQQSLLEPGGDFVFTLTITNTSIETVTISTLTDSQAAQAVNFTQCAALVGQQLAPNQSRSCQYTVVYTEADAYTNTATVTARDNENNPVTQSATVTVNVNDALPTVSLTKTVNQQSLLEPGGNFVFTLSVLNTSVEPVTITALTDSQSAQALTFTQCAALVGQQLLPNQSRSCQYTVAHTEAGAYANSASVTVRDNENNQASNEDTITVTVNDALPTVILTKSATPTRLDEPGGNFVFTLSVLNTSVEPVTITALTDSQSAQATGFAQCTALVGQILAPGATLSCQYSVAHTETGSYDNEASVTVRDNETNTASDTVFITVVVGNTLPSVTLVKSAGPGSRTEPGGDFVFTLTITNTSVEPVTITALSDTQSARAVDFSQCAALVGQLLAINEARSCQYTVAYNEAGVYVNEATVTVKDNEEDEASSKDMVTVTVNDALPLVRLTKTANLTRLDEPGGNFVFTLSVTNNSVEPVMITDLTDSQATQALDFSQCTTLIGQQLAPAQTLACQYTVPHANAGIYANQADVTVYDNEENPASDRAVVTVAVNDLLPLIRVIKTAQPDSVLETGGNVLFLVELFNESVEPLTLATLVDSVFGNLAGVGSCAVSQTVAANGVYRCSFTKLVSGQFGNDHHNVITATAGDDEGNTATAGDDATVRFIQVAPSVQVLKEYKLQADNDKDGRVSPGDTLRYTISLVNNGNGTAFSVFLTDTPDPATILVVPSVTTTKGTVTIGNRSGDTSVEVEIGDILPNGAESVQVVFDVVIRPQTTVPLVRNQALVSLISGQSDTPNTEPSDDPTTPKVKDETITEIFAPTSEEETEEPNTPTTLRLFLPLINQ